MIDDDHLPMMTHGVHDVLCFVSARATVDAACHWGILLCVGVTHFGGLGSYTVMRISAAIVVVQTT